MDAPVGKISILFYRMRGTKIGKNCGIGHRVYIEETVPWLVEIGDNVVIGPRTTITAQDGSYHRSNPDLPKIYKKVIIEDNVYIGAGVNIIRGVTIGKNSIIGAGSVVIRSIPPNSLAVGNPARVIKTIDTMAISGKEELFKK
jgi:maltose O-acetyltransferase